MTRDAELAEGLARTGLPLVALHRPANGAEVPSTPGKLLHELCRSGDPLFQLCAIPLVLRHPGIVRTEATEDQTLLAHLYTAAACLRQLWKTRLDRLGLPPVPDLFSHDLGLPDPAADYGEPCLRTLCDRLENGHAGARIRGADRMIAKLMSETFEILEREAARATTR